jgi:hypothetical protein
MQTNLSSKLSSGWPEVCKWHDVSLLWVSVCPVERFMASLTVDVQT